MGILEKFILLHHKQHLKLWWITPKLRKRLS